MAMQRALEIFIQHGRDTPEMDDFLQACLNMPCECTEMNEMTGVPCTRCDEVWYNPEYWQIRQIKFKLRAVNKHFAARFET